MKRRKWRFHTLNSVLTLCLLLSNLFATTSLILFLSLFFLLFRHLLYIFFLCLPSIVMRIGSMGRDRWKGSWCGINYHHHQQTHFYSNFLFHYLQARITIVTWTNTNLVGGDKKSCVALSRYTSMKRMNERKIGVREKESKFKASELEVKFFLPLSLNYTFSFLFLLVLSALLFQPKLVSEWVSELAISMTGFEGNKTDGM